MNEHWTKHLDEAGAIQNWGSEQESRRRRAADLRKQAQALDKEYQAEEDKIKREALKHWTVEEVSDAQEYAKSTRRVRSDAMPIEKPTLYEIKS